MGSEKACVSCSEVLPVLRSRSGFGGLLRDVGIGVSEFDSCCKVLIIREIGENGSVRK